MHSQWPFLTTLYVGLGGMLGAMLRYQLTLLINRFAGTFFPLGTLFVNTLGGIAIGFLLSWAAVNPAFSANMRAFLVTGLLGGLTTFSTFSSESMAFLQNGQLQWGLINIAANLVLALGGVWLGQKIAALCF